MSTARVPRTPVFVDDSGRRWWIVRAIGWLLATAAVAVVVLGAVAFSVSPSVASTARRPPAPEVRLTAGDVAPHRP